jgi:biotin carboxylase
MATNEPITFICLASEFKGEDFLRGAHEAGSHVILVTEEKHRDKAWPWEAINERFFMPDLSRYDDVIHGVSYLARTRHIQRIIAIDDYDVRLAAELREHLRLPGMGSSPARYFRDKLAMRGKAAGSGLPVPSFVPVLNYDHINHFMATVSPPWVLKPRFEAGAVGINKVFQADEVWPLIHQLGDDQSFYLLEQFIPGDVYHVDALVDGGEIIFMRVSKYARPPLTVSHGGGVFVTRLLPPDAEDTQTLTALTRQFLAATGFDCGATHTEFIRAADGRFYFLETASRVGGANIADMVAAGTGINLWREWARLEAAHAQGQPYTLPPVRDDYAGLLICLARQVTPDLSTYQEPEIVWRMNKPYHAGLIVVSASYERVQTLLQQFSERFAQDFLAIGQPKEAQRTT